MALSKEEIISFMESSESKSEWNFNCKRVKKSYNGRFPKWWFAEMIESGLLAELKIKWEWNNERTY